MDESLWSRLVPDARAEVDGLIAAGRHIQAIATMLGLVGPPRPSLPACVDLLELRARVLRQ
ncbi:hypothetical protein [Streptomyces durhamensis]|uniref:hypothetical protein n=1 Tax=Streptomyces durhamensis TaxID=68194 RepID=UPI0012FEA056|nr:hypothetical protein [Streptomyces durhamensis]